MKNLIFLMSFLSLIVACKPNASDDAARLAEADRIFQDSLNKVNMIIQQQKTIDSLEVVSDRTTTKKSGVRSKGYEPGGRDNDDVVDQVYAPSTVADAPATKTTTKGTPKTKEKEGMSNTTKGAIIGVGAGAVVGAMSSKDRVKGGILGSVIGGSAGAGVGAVIDKKKKKKQQQQPDNN